MLHSQFHRGFTQVGLWLNFLTSLDCSWSDKKLAPGSLTGIGIWTGEAWFSVVEGTSRIVGPCSLQHSRQIPRIVNNISSWGYIIWIQNAYRIFHFCNMSRVQIKSLKRDGEGKYISYVTGEVSWTVIGKTKSGGSSGGSVCMNDWLCFYEKNRPLPFFEFCLLLFPFFYLIIDLRRNFEKGM